ncbi:acyl-CoA synthetase (AMP-forming)/AMP-acid ligase II [Streptomyces sp. LBL]|nr:acyl-CoA synthetase (AMP-forming)/AMP-acid ligase II [Streptomyces sp. LBL]
MTDSRYAAKPWLALLDDAQRAPIDPADSLVHALRRAVAETPDRTFLAYFDGRLSHREVEDMINASGFKVWPREVEDVLYTHPAVREAAVVGVPDGYRGETVKAYVSLRPGAETGPGALAAYCKERLAAYKYPRQVEILPELPKTASGKILRRELRSRPNG